MRTVSLVRSLVWFGAFVAMAQFVSAQTPTASVTGIVEDSSKAIIPGAEVTVLEVNTGVRRQTVSDESGSYVVPLLNPGNYTVSVTKDGFRPISRSGITLLVDQKARIDFSLELGTVSEAVQVSAEAPMVQSEQSSVGTVVQNTSIVNLPLNGGYTSNLAYLVPGVMPGSSSQAGTTTDSGRTPINFQINGARSLQSDVFVDGVALTVPELSADFEVPLTPKVDMVQEFQVETNSLPAEFGRTEGGVIEYVEKPGANAPHGSVYNYLRNSAMDSNAFFTNRAGLPLPSFRRNQFGFTFGGPVLIPHIYNGRDKLFFFVGYEGLIQGSETTLTTTVPTDLERAGNFSQPDVLVGGVCVQQVIYDPRSTKSTASGGFIRTPSRVTSFRLRVWILWE